MRGLAAGALLGLLLSGGTVLAESRGPRPPDVVVILADDLGYGDLGCYGAEQISTPSLDRIAADGVRFTDAHSAAPVCSPARFGLLTGRYAWRDGLFSPLVAEDPLAIPRGTPTLPGFLRDHGYATGCFGKWHLGFAADSGHTVPEGPLDVGFDTYFGAQVRGGGSGRCWIRDHEWIGRVGDDFVSLPEGRAPKSLAVARDPSPVLLEEVSAFLDGAGDRPVFVFLPLFYVHKPWQPQEEFRNRSAIGPYGDVIEEMDWFVGEVQARLRNAGRKDVLWIFTSDNGAATTGRMEHLPNGPFRGRKGQVWEGGHRVPLLVSWPGRIPPGREMNATVVATDLFPTIAAALGAELPAGAATDGVNLLPWLTGERPGAPVREAAVHVSGNGREWALRTGPWKLVLSEDEPPALFDLDSDPAESVDVAASHAGLVADLSARLAAYRTDGGRAAAR